MITVYTKTTCGYCMQVKNLLKKKNIEFQEINIEEDMDAQQFIIAEGHRTVPQLYQDGELFVEGGYNGLKKYLQEQEQHQVLDTATLGDI